MIIENRLVAQIIRNRYQSKYNIIKPEIFVLYKNSSVFTGFDAHFYIGSPKKYNIIDQLLDRPA